MGTGIIIIIFSGKGYKLKIMHNGVGMVLEDTELCHTSVLEQWGAVLELPSVVDLEEINRWIRSFWDKNN